MKTYYEEVKAWLDDPGSSRIPGEALVGLVLEHKKMREVLSECSLVIRCFSEGFDCSAKNMIENAKLHADECLGVPKPKDPTATGCEALNLS